MRCGPGAGPAPPSVEVDVAERFRGGLSLALLEELLELPVHRGALRLFVPDDLVVARRDTLLLFAKELLRVLEVDAFPRVLRLFPLADGAGPRVDRERRPAARADHGEGRFRAIRHRQLLGGRIAAAPII